MTTLTEFYQELQSYQQPDSRYLEIAPKSTIKDLARRAKNLFKGSTDHQTRKKISALIDQLAKPYDSTKLS